MAAPAAAPRRDPPRMRLQPLAGHDVPVKPTAAASALSPPGRQSERGAISRTARSRLVSAHVRRSGGPPGRDVASTTTLAERRAALRRRAIDAGSSAESASPFAAQIGADWLARHAPERRARDRRRTRMRVSAPRRSEIGAGEQDAQPVDPVLFDLDNVTSPSNDLLASAALDRSTHDAFAGDAADHVAGRMAERSGGTRARRDASRRRHACGSSPQRSDRTGRGPPSRTPRHRSLRGCRH